MTPTHELRLKPNLTPGAAVTGAAGGLWHLEIPPGPGGKYRLAQLDDTTGLARRDLLWQPPLTFSLQARASANDLPGTWGFGLWNDPFSLSLGLSGGARRFPALPNASWYFFASPPNYLSLRDDLPAQGALAATFESPRWPAAALALGSPALALLALPPVARWLRRLGRSVVRQASEQIHLDPTDWRAYTLSWRAEAVTFAIDGATVLETSIAPRGPLGLVLWIDNQYAAFPPGGRLAYGTLPNPGPAWIELKEMSVH